MTIGAGVDLSKHSRADITAWTGVDADTIVKITPYVDPDLNGEIASAPLGANGRLMLGYEQAMALTDGAFPEIYAQLTPQYDAATSFSTFEQLPSGVQTAMLDTTYHAGVAALLSYDLWAQTTHGEWQAAYGNLDRRVAEDQPYTEVRRRAAAAKMYGDQFNQAIPSPSRPCHVQQALPI